jgi:hypothetical protein
MRPNAGPRPVLGALHQPGTDRIHLDVARRGIEVFRLHRAGVVTILPEVASETVAVVESLSILPVGGADGLPERFLSWRVGDQVHMIAHKAIAPEFHASFLAAAHQQV